MANLLASYCSFRQISVVPSGDPWPWHKLIKSIDGMTLLDAVEDVGKPLLRVDRVQPADLQQRIHGRDTLTATVGIAKV